MTGNRLQPELITNPDDTADAGPVECLGLTFPNDDARREHFLNLLREKLKDPEFRKIEGFPIGTDEDILALSDPPYYTACPNPFVEDFIRHHGKPYDPTTDIYRREPFAADVSEGKNDSIYNAHSYHTKVPHKAIMRYILHYTEPGDTVFDGFCGTGMTGVAAQLCGDEGTIRALGYSITDEGDIVDGSETLVSKFGSRTSVICDLSPEATLIAHSLNSPFAEQKLQTSLATLTETIHSRCAKLYEVSFNDQKMGIMVYAIWSDVVRCPECLQSFAYSDAAVKSGWTVELDLFSCPACSVSLTTRRIERALETKWDPLLGEVIEISKQLPVLLNYRLGKKRHTKTPDKVDIAKAESPPSLKYNSAPIEELHKLERYFKDSLHLRHYTHVHHLYPPRTWLVLSELWQAIHEQELDARTRQQVTALFTSLLPRLDRLNRYMPDHQRHVGPLVGTLYVSWLTVEISVLDYWADKRKAFGRLKSLPGLCAISTGSSSDARLIPDNSIDYIFTDPPFGHNLQYAELNQRAEAWLRIRTQMRAEAVVSGSQRKNLADYQQIMTESFQEAYRILKPGRWITVEFHNSRNSVWTAIQEAMLAAGFIVTDVRTLNKKKGTTNQLFYVSGAVKQDLVISAYKPTQALEEGFRLEAGTEDGIWHFVLNHLHQLPTWIEKNSGAEIIAERQNYLLFDRMVAFHVQRGVTVSLSASEFYQGLAQRFPERDGMYFLPDQAAEYDKRRMTVKEVLQLSLIVTDESSAIQWLRQQLIQKPQTAGELKPQFMQEMSAWQKNEKLLELDEILVQNFLRYDGKHKVPSQIHSYLSTNYKELRNLPKDHPDLMAKAKDRWYVPDPANATDLEKLREKALLREFEGYLTTKQRRLKIFRFEAVRAGFKKAWQERDYATIIAVAEKIPEIVLQEDAKLLMWYDQAITRSGIGR